MADPVGKAPITELDVRPVVATPGSGNLGLWAFAVILTLGGIWLFSAMSANRAKFEAPAISASAGSGGTRIAAAPDLRLPDDLSGVPAFAEREATLRPVLVRQLPRSQALERAIGPVREQRVVGAPPPQQYPAPPIREILPSVVFDRTFGSTGAANIQPPAQATNDRVRAGRFEKPSLTISQGTVIPAVLETALDSTRPGAARALVQRDVYSFDGTRILIQRGSRIYGEYEAGLNPGEKRALIQWTRLIRPDGVTIALDSPSSDPLGRAGVKGDVDSKFFQRFGGAILQSVLDIGVGVATQKATNGVVVALPGSTQNVQVQDQQTIRPTLKIRQGTSVSIFVARDLDFSSVDF
ncbi:MAG: TrbI/VirB10 family protein [Pontixanthobacter sp.]